ncbi:MAG: TatD family hydrolase [Eggerthellaceae bacterium]|nr:TatD family hydrolase [Eggerthellaceae bacterium]
MPLERDFKFYQRRKHDRWSEVPAPEPALEWPVADSHAHVHMLPDPAWEFERCVANGVDFVCEIIDPSEDGSHPFVELDSWTGDLPVTARIATGVHPHNAKLYDDTVEAQLIERLADPRVGALGEIGLDYHYDLSPRDVQRDVFRRQIDIAQRFDLPIVLHLRGGEDPQTDNAHVEAFAILKEMGALGPRALLHCCGLAPEELAPWVEADCYVAYGGALTFKSAEPVREGAKTVPLDRLMVETDSPYMAPEPMRGVACTPAHVVFTAARLAEVRGIEPGHERCAFLKQLHDNTLAFYANRIG